MRDASWRGGRVGLLAALALVGVVLVGCSASAAPRASAHPPSPTYSSTTPSTGTRSSATSSGPSPSVPPVTASPAAATPGATATAATHTAPRVPASMDGTLLSVLIPGGATHFRPRAAELYLPAILRTRPDTRLPVLELLHGTPSAPTIWVHNGGLVTTMNDFAATHGGRAPIVVMPDVNGSQYGDSECVRTPYGADVEDYLTRVVPGWVRTHYRTAAAPTGWAIAGLSEGGTCAVMLALRAHEYSTFVDLSGLSRPTVGEHDAPGPTIAALFGGSRAAYDEHDPTFLLAHHRYPGLGGWYECGSADTEILPSQRLLVALSRRAGLAVVERFLPGKHVWKVWGPALAESMPWVWSRIA